MEYLDYTEWFRTRLSQLRMDAGVSARDMSLSLGQSESYINKIENRRTLPSMTGFFYICDYFHITPHELEKLTPQQTEHILQLVRDLTED